MQHNLILTCSRILGRDSIVKSIIVENDFHLVILGERNENNQLIKMTYIANDTTQKTFTYKYDNNSNLIQENSYLEENIPLKFISREFENNLLKLETIEKYNHWDTLQYQKIYEYDDFKRISFIKEDYENENNYTLNSKEYDLNSNLIWEKIEPIGASRYSILIWKWNQYGNLIEYSSEDNQTKKKKVWTYKYNFDEIGNWISQEKFKNDSPLNISKRKITYY